MGALSRGSVALVAVTAACGGSQPVERDASVDAAGEHALTVHVTGDAAGSVDSAPPGLTCSGDCTRAYPAGTTVSLTAAPAADAVFAGWSGACSGTDPCTVTLTADAVVTARFARSQYPLVVTIDGAGTGTVVSTPPGIDCGTTCTTQVAFGATVSLVATPATGSQVAWSGGGCSGGGPCTLTIDGATTVNARFSLRRYSLAVGPAGTGTGRVSSIPAGIDCGAACSASFDFGTEVALTAIPAAGSRFAGWLGSCGGPRCQPVMTTDQTVDAIFSLGGWPDSETNACPSGCTVGSDDYYVINPPTYSCDAEVAIDSVTGLWWERYPPYTQLTWPAAQAYCADLVLSGHDDWRLPTTLELVSLLDANRLDPAWPVDAFPDIPLQLFFWWTDTGWLGGAAYHVVISTAMAWVSTADNNSTQLVRCVRGSAFAGALAVVGSTVVDGGTGLTWQSGSGGSRTWLDAVAYCENLDLAGSAAWRLPTVKELYSIVDYGESTPAISPLFSSRPSGVFWTSTGGPGGLYVVDFAYGQWTTMASASAQASTILDVRCVH